MLPPLPPGWFIAPFTQIPALSNLCVCVFTDQPGQLPAAPAEQLSECFVLPCVLQETPPAAFFLGTAPQTAFPDEHEMLWCTCGSMRPLPTPATLARVAPAPCNALLHPLALLSVALRGSAPSFSFPLLSKENPEQHSMQEGYLLSSVWEGCSKICLFKHSSLSLGKHYASKLDPPSDAQGNCQSELKAVKGQGYNSVPFKCQDFVWDGGREVATNVISIRSTLL